ncbi:MAG: hypothetical protein JST00_25230 [Deltaproteobacteria bacterium]|nr:hypothetical protein [Deltaproteobacteria bacterium]
MHDSTSKRHDPRPFGERDTLREIDSAIALDVDDDDIEILATADHRSEGLSEPFHWCDYHCRRCPLSSTCEVPPSDRGSLASVLAELEGALAAAVGSLTEELARAGLPADAPSEVALATVTALEGRRLVRLAKEVNVRVAEAAQAGLVPIAISIDTIRLVGKSARITGEGYAPAPHDCDTSVVPGDLFANVMHLEHLVGSLEEQMAAMPPVAAATAARAALAEYARCFAGWAARVPPAFRARLVDLVRSGRGPSPFTRIER